jgi:putative peptidoglycan lipid II flippase
LSVPGEPPAPAEPPTRGEPDHEGPAFEPTGTPEGEHLAEPRPDGDGETDAPGELPEEGIQRVASAQLTGASPVLDAEESIDGDWQPGDPHSGDRQSGDPPEQGGEREVAHSATSKGVARNTAIFSIGTGISRVVGLLREIVFASYFGTSGEASAYTIASLVPNLVAQLFANAALSAAFVPVFTDLLQQGRRKDALRLASTLFWIMLIVLGAVSAFFILAAGTIMPLFIGPTFTPALNDLTIGLSQVLFPVVLLLGLTGLLTGILQSYDHFTIPAISPAVWNLVIIVLLVVLAPHFHGNERVYAYAIGILAATGVQMALAFGALGRIDFRLQFHIDWHDPRIRQVFMLMLPVTIGLGIVNLDQLINSAFGSLVSDEAPRAIDNAFRIYMLPQGMFSVAVATVLFPVLSRLAARRDSAGMRSTVGTGMRQINLLLIPAAAFMIVLATPITRLVFERGHFDAQSTKLVSEALFWFAFSLPFAGINLLLTRTFFALQRPWIPTRLAAMNIVVDIVVSVGLYKPLGIAGLVIGTVVANAVMTALQLHRLRIGFNGRLEGGQTTMITARIAVASALLAGVSWVVWYALHAVLGHSLPAQIVAMGAAGGAGVWIYTRSVLAMHIPEAHQVNRMIRARLGRA